MVCGDTVVLPAGLTVQCPYSVAERCGVGTEVIPGSFAGHRPWSSWECVALLETEQGQWSLQDCAGLVLEVHPVCDWRSVCCCHCGLSYHSGWTEPCVHYRCVKSCRRGHPYPFGRTVPAAA